MPIDPRTNRPTIRRLNDPQFVRSGWDIGPQPRVARKWEREVDKWHAEPGKWFEYTGLVNLAPATQLRKQGYEVKTQADIPDPDGSPRYAYWVRWVSQEFAAKQRQTTIQRGKKLQAAKRRAWGEEVEEDEGDDARDDWEYEERGGADISTDSFGDELIG